MERKHKFNSLTPEVLPENKAVYTEALDFAFSNNDIKNIAITGIYGAGKSSVWKTYEEKEKLKERLQLSSEIVKSFALAGLNTTMNEYNGK